MIKKCFCAAAVALALVAMPAVAGTLYSSSLGGDFQADADGNGGTPANNPFGGSASDWEFQSFDNTNNPLVSQGGIPINGQPGWCPSDGAGGCVPPSTDPGYGYTFNEGWAAPGTNHTEAVVGHGKLLWTWTAPADVDEGGVTFSGGYEQRFEPDRLMRLRIVGPRGSATVLASPPADNSGLFLNDAPFSIDFPANPGDVFEFHAEPANVATQGGNGVATFVSVELTATEAAIPEPASAMLVGVGLVAFVLGFRSRTRHTG